jgi:hypothetical protein
MKKTILILLVTLVSMTQAQSQVAVDFTANDCSGVSYNLYTELNSGKVIVLCFVMPCVSCIGPSLTAYNIVQSYASPNVVFYLLDDYGNTNCTTVNGWALNNNIGPNRVTFSTPSVIETMYGGAGMPHIVIVGPDHNIYFNGLNAAAGNPTAIQNAINNALAVTSIPEHKPVSQFNVSVYDNAVTLNFNLTQNTFLSIELIDILGNVIKNENEMNLHSGIHSLVIYDSALPKGIYFVRLITPGRSISKKLLVN